MFSSGSAQLCLVDNYVAPVWQSAVQCTRVCVCVCADWMEANKYRVLGVCVCVFMFMFTLNLKMQNA